MSKLMMKIGLLFLQFLCSICEPPLIFGTSLFCINYMLTHFETRLNVSHQAVRHISRLPSPFKSFHVSLLLFFINFLSSFLELQSFLWHYTLHCLLIKVTLPLDVNISVKQSLKYMPKQTAATVRLADKLAS